MIKARALHYVLKIGNRKKSIEFFKKVLKMKVLRHEEFKEGCEASCNGPYDGAWSKTMIGYGNEDTSFVLELTYNYGIGQYSHGNDFQAIHINDESLFKSVSNDSYPYNRKDADELEIISPCGYKFMIHNSSLGKNDKVSACSLSSTNIDETKKFWHGLLHMNIINEKEDSISMSYGVSQCCLEFINIKKPIDHAKAYGRIAFSTCKDNLEKIQQDITLNNHAVLKPLVGLDTPGKARVYVVILADPDGHEICFVGDEAFRELSKCDPNADNLLDQAMNSDKSEEWFSKRKGKLTQ